MKKIILLSIITFIFCLVSIEDTFANNLKNNKYVPINLATEEEYLEIFSIIDCFKAYTYFFNETKLVNGEIISLQAENFEDGVVFLTRCFSEEIVLNMLDYYTYVNVDKKQAITPQEGIPVFTEKDMSQTSFCKEDERITLKVNYYNCYELNDHYIYYITAYKANGKYIVNDLNWQKIMP